MRRILIFLYFLMAVEITFATNSKNIACSDLPSQKLITKELNKIREADQIDRAWQINGQKPSKDQLIQMSKNDSIRRARVAEIAAANCLSSIEDFEVAYLIFQHGTNSDDFSQAYLWAKKVIELGNSKFKSELANAIDRYLVSIEHKQLFGTQATLSPNQNCWCLEEMEHSFPQSLISEYRGGEVSKFTGLNYLKILNTVKSCLNQFCPKKLKPTPKGSVPGFW